MKDSGLPMGCGSHPPAILLADSKESYPMPTLKGPQAMATANPASVLPDESTDMVVYRPEEDPLWGQIGTQTLSKTDSESTTS